MTADGPVSVLVVGEASGSALSQLLLDRAVGAASELGAGEVAVEVVPGTEVRARASSLLTGGAGRLLVVWPRLPVWRPSHLAAALEDLDDGCGVSIGPLFDGGFYLLALAHMVPELFALDDAVLVGPRAMGEIFGAAATAGLEVGLLRAERALRRPSDVAAAQADPLLDEELRGLLER